MSHSFAHAHEQWERGSISSAFTKENTHSTSSGASFSLQSFVDDIPFEFNPKYRTVLVSDIDIDEYDTRSIRDILNKAIDFALEKHVLLEALNDVQRKKRSIEENIDRQHQPLETFPTRADQIGVEENEPSSRASRQPSNSRCRSSSALSQSAQRHLPASASMAAPSASFVPSFRLPSVRDIYWPCANPHHYEMPVNDLSSRPRNLPMPIHSSQGFRYLVGEKTEGKNPSYNRCPDDLSATFDGTLISDDPFHNAELQSLNDIDELNHLYSAVGVANTDRR